MNKSRRNLDESFTATSEYAKRLIGEGDGTEKLITSGSGVIKVAQVDSKHSPNGEGPEGGSADAKHSPKSETQGGDSKHSPKGEAQSSDSKHSPKGEGQSPDSKHSPKGEARGADAKHSPKGEDQGADAKHRMGNLNHSPGGRMIKVEDSKHKANGANGANGDSKHKANDNGASADSKHKSNGANGDSKHKGNGNGGNADSKHKSNNNSGSEAHFCRVPEGTKSGDVVSCEFLPRAEAARATRGAQCEPTTPIGPTQDRKHKLVRDCTVTFKDSKHSPRNNNRPTNTNPSRGGDGGSI